MLSNHWMCEFCGREVFSSRMPAPSKCSEAPFSGSSHSWIQVEEGRHRWRCSYCGQGVEGSMPKPGNSCSLNPYGKNFHQWIQE